VKLTPTEQRLTYLMAAVQFAGILSFMIVMPLGPDFTTALGIDPSLVGWVMAAYMLASAASGLLSALFIDRFDRRPAMAVAMVGLVLSSIASGLAWNLESLLAARVVAGVFGGPSSALAIAIVADNIPPERRGQAMGIVLGSLSVAAVVGVPLGLEIAHWFDWRWTFFLVAALCAGIVVGTYLLLPPQQGHLADVMADRTHAALRLARIARRRLSLIAFALGAVAITPGFLVITNLAVFIQFNLGFPREHLGLLYMVGGAVSFFGMRLTGRMVDRFGSTPVTTVSTLGMIATIWLIYYDWAWLALPLILLVPGFMLFNTARMVAQNTAVSKVPEPAERAGFMALVQTSTQIFGGLAGLMASAILTTAPDGRLENMSTVAGAAVAIGLLGPVLMWRLERNLPPDRQPSLRVKAAAAKVEAAQG